MAEVLRVDGVVKEYGERVLTRAVDGVDLSLQSGEFAALIGPSGSGKSTLLNLLGLLDKPTRGRIVIDEQDTTGLDEDALSTFRRRHLGFVFQFHHLLPALTAVENVMLPMWADASRPSRAMIDRATDLLAAVGLAERADARSNELSGGQQQRVAIARALAMRPSLVLADEPTGNLDTRSADEVFALLRRVNRELGTTFLVVTHDPRLAARTDRVVEIVDGRIVSDKSLVDGR